MPEECMNKYNTFGRRFWAAMIDGLVLWPLSFIDEQISPQNHGTAFFIVWIVFSYTLYWLYSVFLHARYGQTLGKMVTKITVLDVSETRIPSLRQALIRDIGFIVLNSLALAYAIYLAAIGEYAQGADYSSVPGEVLTWAGLGWFFLEITTMLTNHKRRAFHDYIAGTVVIQGNAT